MRWVYGDAYIKMTTVLDLYEATSSYNPLSQSTRYGWRHAIKGFEHRQTEDIDRLFVVKHRSELLGKGYKQGYVRTRLGYLGSMWQTGIDIQLLTENPWRGSLKRLTPSRKKYPQKFFDTFSDFHEDPLFMGLWYHGFRVSELACLLPEDFVTDAPIPYINVEHNHIRRCKNDYTQRHVPHPLSRFISEFPFTTNPNAGDYFQKTEKTTGIQHTVYGIRLSPVAQAGIGAHCYGCSRAQTHRPTASYGETFLKIWWRNYKDYADYANTIN